MFEAREYTNMLVNRRENTLESDGLRMKGKAGLMGWFQGI